MDEIFNHCSLLWERFNESVRGLVFIDCSQSALESALRCVPQPGSELQKTALHTLLEAYSVLPDLYKVAIKGMIESVSTHSEHDAKLVVSGLHRHQVLPGVMFRMLAASMDLDARVTDVVRFLDDVFRPGAAQWIGRHGSGVQPKYASAGNEIRQAVYRRFSQMDLQQRQQHGPAFVRVVSGLIGYLRLDVYISDHAFLSEAAAAADSRTSTLCAALMLVLVGLGPDISEKDTLDMLKRVADSPAAGSVDCILVFLKTDHLREIGSLVGTTLNMDFAFPHERLFYLKDIVAQSSILFFTGASLARRLLSRNIVDIQHDSQQTALYTEAVLYSLQGSLFQDAGVDARPWICRRVEAADITVANSLGDLIQAYVVALFSSAAIMPIPEAYIWKVFAAERIQDPSGSHAPPAQVLCLLYIMHYCAKLADQPKTLGTSFPTFAKQASLDSPGGNGAQPWTGQLGVSLGLSTSRTNSNSLHMLQLRTDADMDKPSLPPLVFSVARRGEYSDELLDSLSVSWILQRVGRGTEYQRIWPELLAMATAQFPDQLDVVSVLQSELAGTTAVGRANHVGIGRGGLDLSVSQQSSVSYQATMNHAWKLIKSVNSSSADSNEAQPKLILQSIELYAGFPVSVRMETCGQFAAQLCQAAMEAHASKELTAHIRRAWYTLHALNPRRVSASTVGVWRSPLEQTKPKLAAQDIWLDPLSILRMDVRVFESADLADILLTVLAESLIQSRTALRRIFALRHREGGVLQKTHVSAMIQLQEASAVQLLIEAVACARNARVRWLVFEFIHARFLEQRTIQKLVHFQAYDVTAIDDMVAHVPSMHACSEFIPELLVQSAPGLQLFAVRLAAAVVAKYPIASNEGLAKEVILPHIQTTLVQIAGSATTDQLAVGNSMFEAIVVVSTAFVLIRNECAQLAKAVKAAAVDRAKITTQQQKECCARWAMCCDSVLAAVEAETAAARAKFVPIEDINTDAAVAALEALLKSDKKSGSGRNGSPKPDTKSGSGRNGSPKHAESSTLPPASAQQQSPSFYSAPMQSQFGAAAGNQKRPHSTMAGERGPRPPPGKRDDGPTLPGLSRSNGAIPGLRNLQPPPGSVTPNGGTLPSPHTDGQTGGPSAMPGTGGFKRRGRHRSRGPNKDGGPKRSRNVSVERQRKNF
ncbi:hypothetical protein LPJ67_001022 [Coemansia sp. RSA 1938]|nr:hypothetical protein LPJ67_001022 [Coemansia sp. RSA 1938]